MNLQLFDIKFYLTICVLYFENNIYYILTIYANHIKPSYITK